MVLLLTGSMERLHSLSIRSITPYFSFLSFSHIYREHNKDADTLSKRGLGGQVGILHFIEKVGSDIIREGNIKLF